MSDKSTRMVVGRPGASVLIVDIAALEPQPGWSISTGDHVAPDPVGRGAHGAWKVIGLIGAGADRVDEGITGRQPGVVVADDLVAESAVSYREQGLRPYRAWINERRQISVRPPGAIVQVAQVIG